MITLTGVRVTLHMRSGRRVRFSCAVLVKTFSGNELRGLETRGERKLPFYICLDEIEAITTRTILRPRWL